MRFTRRSFPLVLPAFGVILGATACGSLRESRLDREMRAHGIYRCEPRSVPVSPRVAAGAAQVRCHRDQLELDSPRAKWIRSFHAREDCSGATLGVAEWSAPIIEVGGSSAEIAYGAAEDRRIIRRDPNWFVDLPSGCDLRSFALDRPVRAAGKCRTLLPAPEEPGARKIALVSEGDFRESVPFVQGNWAGFFQRCSR